jgi:hypothetical protein
LRAFALLLSSLLAPAFAFASDYSLAPTPSWVIEQTPGASSRAQVDGSSDGVSYLLVDSQVYATRQARSRYFRYVSQALNAKGVESIANLGIDFDPSWQQLQLHSVRVLRDGHAIDKLAGARIELIQQEKELDELIYNGSKTARIFLDDVRVGDIVDYSFSTIGRNPVFDGQEFGETDLQWGVPVAKMHARLLVPADLPMSVHVRNTGLHATVAVHDGLRDYRWSMADTPALTVEAGAPDGYSPFAEVEWSAFPDWAAVSRWAEPLYRTPARLSPALEAEARRIEREQAGATGRMLAALRFVQREVRYLGVETGRNTHAPNPPDLVFARRFGDCKDKALLTLSLLARLGVEAHPALVNTESQRAIAGWLPNPGAFDHVIVRAQADGKSYWIDPTRPAQESDAAHLYQPDFRLALVVAPGTHGLVSMANAGSLSRRSVHVVLDARRDFDQAVGFRVVTTYEGGAAEAQRDELAGTSLSSLQDDYLKYYAASYPGIALAAPLQVADDKRGNRLAITESYTIADIASKPDQDGKHTVWVETPDVDELLKDPEAKIRRAPLALRYPLDVSQTTEVLLPEQWQLQASDERIDDPAFSFRRSILPDGDRKRVVIHDEYRTLADEVAAKEMPRYTANLAKARGELGYSLTWSDALAPPPSSPVAVAGWFDRFNWPVSLLVLAFCAGMAPLARRAWRYDPAPRGEAVPVLAGIRGWLRAYGIVAWLLPLALARGLVSILGRFGMPQWSAFTAFGGAHYHPGWAPALLFELLAQLSLLAAAVLLVALYLRRRSSYPRLAAAFFVALVLLKVVDIAIAGWLPGAAPGVHRLEQFSVYLLGAVACSAYLLLSRRVRSTFVRRAGVDPVPAAVWAVPPRAQTAHPDSPGPREAVHA